MRSSQRQLTSGYNYETILRVYEYRCGYSFERDFARDRCANYVYLCWVIGRRGKYETGVDADLSLLEGFFLGDVTMIWRCVGVSMSRSRKLEYVRWKRIERLFLAVLLKAGICKHLCD